MNGPEVAGPKLSLVLVAYDMRRELPRTIRSLSPPMQRGVDASDYELIVVDNGSAEPPDREECEALGARIRWLRIDDALPSPASAINRGIAAATAPLIGVMIDGARLATPGVLRYALLAADLHPRPVVATVGFHLGPDLQRRAIKAGYDRDAEDALLDGVDWTGDGYRLFDVSVFAGSSSEGWFSPPKESNALFMPAELWEELGGFDERFITPGGGFVNTDTFARACELPDSRLIILLGEGTFHQIHGGVATNSPVVRRTEFREEYERLTGREPAAPDVQPVYLGTVAPQARASLGASASAEPSAERDRASVQRRRYLGLLTKTLLNLTGLQAEAAYLVALDAIERGETLEAPAAKQVRARIPDRYREVLQARRAGRPLRADDPGFALTNTGQARLNRIKRCVSTAIVEAVPGDLVQCGVNRGGTAILMRGVLAAREVTDRTVWVADPFSDPGDQERLARTFDLFDLLDDQVTLLPVELDETLLAAPIERIAVLHLNSAGHDETLGSLSALYDRLSPGGFVIVDRYGAEPGCKEAVDAFRRRRGIDDAIERIDGSGIQWRRAE